MEFLSTLLRAHFLTLIAIWPFGVLAYFSSWRAAVGALLRVAILVTSVAAYMAITGAGWNSGRALPTLLVGSAIALGSLTWALSRIERPELEFRRIGSMTGLLMFFALIWAFIMGDAALRAWRALFTL